MPCLVLRVYLFFQAIMVLDVILSRSLENCPSNSAGSAFISRLERESEQIQASGNGRRYMYELEIESIWAGSTGLDTIPKALEMQSPVEKYRPWN